jgi:predicted nucleic acid-binding protein
MNGYLIDANVLAELRRTRPHAGVLDFLRQTRRAELFLSEVTVAEIRFGIERVTVPKRRSELVRWLDESIRPLFLGRILPVGEDVWLIWRVLLEEGRQTGYTYPQPDLVLAATAAHHGLAVVTRDVEPFVRAGVPVRDPWAESR